MIAADDVDRIIEQARNILLQFGIYEDADGSVRFDLDRDVEDASGAAVAACDGAEQRGAAHAARAKVPLVAAQDGKDILGLHALNLTTMRSFAHVRKALTSS